MSLAGDWEVKYDNDARTLGNVQEIYLDLGRRQVTDTWQTSRLRIVVWYPDPTGILIPGIGDKISLFGPANATVLRQWTGRVSDMRQIYGAPYDSALGYAVADYLIIEAEGGLADWSRITTDGYTVTSTNARDAIIEVAAQFGLEVLIASSVANVPIQATTIVGSIGAWLQDIIATGQLRVLDGQHVGATSKVAVGFYLTDPITTSSTEFTDTTIDATHLAYDSLEADSLADNYYTEVIVTSPSVGEATSTLAGATPVRTLEISTLAATVAQCQEIADYVRQALDTAELRYSSLSTKTNGQAAVDVNLDLVIFTLPRYRINIEFRGVTRGAVIEGLELTVRPDGQRITYHLSGAGYYSALRLDSATQGLLNINTLGLY